MIDDLEQAYRLIAQHPGASSPRQAFELRIPDLRSLRPKRTPYLIFYVERPDHVDVWRVPQANRDIPAWLAEPSRKESEP